MIVFRGIEPIQRGNLCHDGFVPHVSSAEFVDKFFGDGFLLFIVIEDCRTILCALIGALLVQCGRVVDREENLQDFPVRNLGRIESHLNCFGVAGAVGADLLIGGINGRGARVAGNDVLNPLDFLEDRFNAPEAAASKSGDF